MKIKSNKIVESNWMQEKKLKFFKKSTKWNRRKRWKIKYDEQKEKQGNNRISFSSAYYWILTNDSCLMKAIL